MKITFFSDTHRKHDKLKFQGGDVLVFCGDLSSNGSLIDVESFAKFTGKLNYEYKIMIAGNHDFCFENENKMQAEKILKDNNLIYLNDSQIIIDGVKFWGSPVQPWFYDWAFNRKRGEDIQKHWKLIPNDTDILITHGPPYGILDLCHHGDRVGCSDLLTAVEMIKPSIHAFGHIHECYGSLQVGQTLFVNACNLNEKYTVTNPPIDYIFNKKLEQDGKQ